MSEPKPQVSLVVPLYNGEDYIAECLDSLIKQKDIRLEIIVVNDGSTDQSEQVLEPYRDKIHYYSQKNQGQAAALNFGWKQATGELIGYLSCDDSLKENALREMYQVLANDPVCVGCYPNYDLISSRSEFIKTIEAPEFHLQDLVVDFICQPGPGALFKKPIFEQAGGWKTNLKQMPDQEFWMRLCLFGPLKKVDKNLANFRIHENSQSYAIATKEKAQEPIQIARSYFDHSDAPEAIKKLKKSSFASAHILSSRLHLRSGRYFMGFNNYLKSFMYSPLKGLSLRSLRLIASGFISRLKYRLYTR